MAKAVLSVVMGKLESMAGERAGEEFRLLLGVQKQAKKLRDTFQLIEAVLQDAEEKQLHKKGVKVWMQKLKHVMYDAEDVLDDWFAGASVPRSALTHGTGNGIMNKVFSYLSSHCSCIQSVFTCLFGDNFRSLDVHYDIAHKIKDIGERLDALIRDKDLLNLVPNQREEDNHHFKRSTFSMVDMSEICGRESDRKEIASWLQGESSKQGDRARVPVISIVGMGGLGKTTLVQIIYNEDTTKTAFDLRMWVCVSEPFDVKRVAREILEQAGGDANIDKVGSEALHQRLRGCVQGKRFLLVLDDVWSKDPDDWKHIKLSLDAGERGSRIIITTRDKQVANMIGPNTHNLELLPYDDSCDLFWKIASLERSQKELLQGIGEDIVQKCKGVPLAIKTIASLMRSSETEEDWRNVLVNGIWDVDLVEKSMLPPLLLSYYALSPQLKQCFTYCATFPKDSIIEKTKLVQLWMAQGYLGQDYGNELEKIGEKFFKDLALCSLFQDFSFDSKRNIISCKMHDLVHDLAHFLTETECLVLESNDIISSSNHFRHLYACRAKIPHILKERNLRSLMIKKSKPALSELCNGLRYLRVLDLSHAGIEGVTDEVGRLIHLRYLDLSGNYELEELPGTIRHLTNLQTLKLNRCSSLSALPESIGELSKLRHLEIEHTRSWSYFPRSIGKLRHLRTLCKFIVSGGSDGCTVVELQSLNHLARTLALCQLWKAQNVEANQAELQKKEHLRCLELYFGSNKFGHGEYHNIDSKRMEGVLDGLQPNANLERLVIYDYPGFTFPFWMSRELLLSNVVKLELQGCNNCIKLPSLGCLESLEHLSIENFEAVEHIGHEFYGSGVEISFPKLKELRLEGMSRCKDWKIPFSNFKKVMPCLSYLELKNCTRLMRLPALGRLEFVETIMLNRLHAVKRVDAEFLVISSVGSKIIFGGGGEHQEEQSIFPRLKKLTFDWIEDWEEWDLPIMLFHQNVPQIEIMPQLSSLSIETCPTLKAVPNALGKLQSLERLILGGLFSVKHLGADLFGISGGSAVAAAENGESTSSPAIVLFQRLTYLSVEHIPEWDADEDMRIIGIMGTSTVAINASIMPGLKELRARGFFKLKVMPQHMLSPSLRKLFMGQCPALTGLQPCFPPLLEHLELFMDLGVLSKSLVPVIPKDNIYPNVKYLIIRASPHHSLPEGWSKFTSLERLEIEFCPYLDLNPEEELRHLTMLQELMIWESPILSERCIREDWRNKFSSQISYRIVIDSIDLVTGERIIRRG